MSRLFLTATILIISLNYISAEIEIKELDVPPQAHRNKDLLLSCHYDLKGHPLESVSWFFNSSEIYRHTENPQLNKEVFNVGSHHIDINVSKSNSTVLALRKLSLHATGYYKCSVNTDAPDFDTEEREKWLEVVVIPTELPVMEGIPEKGFKRGSTISINCTSAPSKPVSILSFKANGKKVPSKHIEHFPTEETEDGLFISKVALLLKYKGNLFRKGIVELTCFSKIRTIEKASALAIVKSSGDTISQSLVILIISLLVSIRR